MADDLSDRARDVLKVVVREFIHKGDPVGSSHLSQLPDFDVSSATMRNVLAELEELGYLEKPHTSAGRVPTDQGYRFFVDSMVALKEPNPQDRRLIEQGLTNQTSVEERLADASKMLHQLSQHAAVVLTPRPNALVVNRIELLRLRDDRVLAILVGPGGQVLNKLVTVDFPLAPEELTQSQNYLNELLKQGIGIDEVRGRLLQELESERSQYDQLVAKALRLGAAATELPQEKVLIEGQGTFLDTPEFAENVKRMRALFKALDDKHKLLALLDRVQRAREMQIFIGAESEFSSQGDVTVIASPYGSKDNVLGTVGVIGPTRMNYQRIIGLVDFTAQVLSKGLDEK